MSKQGKQSRYPGIRSFERSESQLFFGRSKESEELFSMIKVKPLTVLFAKSGIGKTSLLNAGVIPLLEQDFFFPVKVRLQDTSINPIEAIKETLKPYYDPGRLVNQVDQELSLWELIKACNFEKNGESFVPVFLFDQFEEFFNHSTENQAALVPILSDLINERLPQVQQQAFRAIPRADRSEAQLDWFSPAKIRIVFSIRSDRMSMLDDLKTEIPTVLHDRFQLRSLSRETATRAIVEPAQLEEDRFETNTFTYASGALTEMLDALSNESGEVESFQLQLLCQYIEEKVKQKTIIGTVKSHDFGGQEGIQVILNDYYERSIRQLSPENQASARRFIEEGLIVNGKRVGVAEGAEKARFGISAVLLEQLLESRLIRSETIHLGKIYELSHDTLVEPILDSYEKRRLEEERELVAKKIEEEKAKAAEANKKRNRARLYAIAGFTLFFLALIASYLAYLNSQQAKANERKAKASALAAKAWVVYEEDHTLALRIAEAALNIDPENSDAIQTLNEMVNAESTSYYTTVMDESDFDVTSIAFSPDSKFLLAGDLKGNVRLWSQTGKLLRRFLGKYHDQPIGHEEASITDLEFAVDGQTFISAGLDKKVILWTIEGRIQQEFEHESGVVGAFFYGPDQILTADKNGNISIWKLTGELLQSFNVNQQLSRIDINIDQASLAIACQDGSIELWHLGGYPLQQFSNAKTYANSVDIHPSGNLIAASFVDGSVIIWQKNGAKELEIDGFAEDTKVVKFSENGSFFGTASDNNTVKLWSLEGLELQTLQAHTEKVISLDFSPDSNYLASGSFDWKIRLWDLDINLNNKRMARHANSVLGISSNNDGLIATGGVESKVKLWDFEGNPIRTMDAHDRIVVNVRFSADGAQLLSCARDNKAILWDTSGNIVQEFIHPGQLEDGYFVPNSELIATVGGKGDGQLRLWNRDGEITKQWQVSSGPQVRSIEFFEGGRKIVTSSRDDWVKIWDLEGNLLDSIKNNGIGLNWATALEDGSAIYFIGNNSVPIKKWLPGTDSVKSIFGHIDENYHLTVAPDQKKLLTSNWDKSVKLWDLDGNLLLTLNHPDGVYKSSFSRDGKYILTGCRDDIGRIWDLEGNLISLLGGYQHADEILTTGKIAKLDEIPFTLSRYDIPLEYSEFIFSGSPKEYIRQGKEFEDIGASNTSNYEKGVAAFENSIKLYKSAKLNAGDLETTEIDYDSIIANAYIGLANHYLLNRKTKLALAATQEGLEYKSLSFLNSYEVIALALNSRFEEANQKYQALKDLPAYGILWADNYMDLIGGDLDYFKVQIGIEHPDLNKLLEIVLNDIKIRDEGKAE